MSLTVNSLTTVVVLHIAVQDKVVQMILNDLNHIVNKEKNVERIKRIRCNF